MAHIINSHFEICLNNLFYSILYGMNNSLPQATANVTTRLPIDLSKTYPAAFASLHITDVFVCNYKLHTWSQLGVLRIESILSENNDIASVSEYYIKMIMHSNHFT